MRDKIRESLQAKNRQAVQQMGRMTAPAVRPWKVHKSVAMPTGPGGLGGLPGANIPISDELRAKAKKQMKEAGIKEDADVSDDVQFSAAAQKLPSTSGEKMMADVKQALFELDEESDTFLDDATEKLLGSVIGREFGEHLSRDPGFPQMQEKLLNTLLENPDYRERITDFLEIMLMTKPIPEEELNQEEEEVE